MKHLLNDLAAPLAILLVIFSAFFAFMIWGTSHEKERMRRICLRVCGEFRAEIRYRSRDASECYCIENGTFKLRHFFGS